MKIFKSSAISFLIIILFNSCSSFSDAGKALRNDKTLTNDEFLIKKKDPLTQPPDFETIPMPGENPEKTDESNIRKILKNNGGETSKSKTQPSSTEDSIINQINK